MYGFFEEYCETFYNLPALFIPEVINFSLDSSPFVLTRDKFSEPQQLNSEKKNFWSSPIRAPVTSVRGES